MAVRIFKFVVSLWHLPLTRGSQNSSSHHWPISLIFVEWAQHYIHAKKHVGTLKFSVVRQEKKLKVILRREIKLFF